MCTFLYVILQYFFYIPLHRLTPLSTPPAPQGAGTTESLGVLKALLFGRGTRSCRPCPFIEQRRKLSPNQGSPRPRSPAVQPPTPCQAVCKGQRHGKSQSLTRVLNPCGQGSQTHQVRTWSQRKKGRSAISPSLGTAPVGSSWTSDAAGCGVPCGVTARRAPLSLDDQNSQGEWTQVILLSFYSETMWKLPACGRRRDRSPPGPCEFSLSPGFSCHSLTFSRWPEVGPGL